MKSNELRIGNLVSNGEKNYTVDANMLYDIAYVGNVAECLNPIPLTPEILEKTGFVYRNEHRGKGAIMDFNKQAIGIAENKFVYLTAWNAPCAYLHQLQNLYFALTGEELPIEL